MDPNEKLFKGVGSRYYLAPEILKKQVYDDKVDVWSATIVVYILLTGDMPFPGNTVKEVANMIKEKDLKREFSRMRFMSKEAKDFLLAGIN